MMHPTILVIDDDPLMLEGLAKRLAKEGFEVHQARDGESGLRLLREQPVHVILTDLRMPGLDGFAVLREVKEQGGDVEVVMLTGHGSIDLAVQATKEGAYDFLTKPPDPDRLIHTITRAAERHALRSRARAFEAGQAELAEGPFIGESAAMRKLLGLIEQVAPTDATVLILGESGTGKELVARAIHRVSPRRTEPLVTVNCAAVPEQLLESELFGHEKGAFTGATHRKPGRFELADGGTLFLDELAELPQPAQAKLLRVLQEREIEPLGGTRTRRVDVRIIAATNQDLVKLVSERRFREDLYYRLNVVTLVVPPLRDRTTDIFPLAEHFLRLYARQLGKRVEGFTADFRAVIEGYRWPGNVRQLEHAIHRALILTSGREISAVDLALPEHSRKAEDSLPTTATLEEVERFWIARAVERCGGNQKAAAEALGIDRSTLHRKLKGFEAAK
jgi:two-component system response regulator HydG